MVYPNSRSYPSRLPRFLSRPSVYSPGLQRFGQFGGLPARHPDQRDHRRTQVRNRTIQSPTTNAKNRAMMTGARTSTSRLYPGRADDTQDLRPKTTRGGRAVDA